jgi:hypothetical protein
MEMFGKLKHSSLLCRGINYTLGKFNDRRSWSQSYKENLEQNFSLSIEKVNLHWQSFWAKNICDCLLQILPHTCLGHLGQTAALLKVARVGRTLIVIQNLRYFYQKTLQW